MSIRLKAEEIKKYSWAETGTAIFAFLNLVPATIVFLIILGYNFTLPVHHHHENSGGIWAYEYDISNIYLGVIFIFAILLFIGVYQNKPSLVLAYVVFGVILDIIMICGIFLVSYPKRPNEFFYAILFIILAEMQFSRITSIMICIVYALLLCMITRAWFLMRSRGLNGTEKVEPIINI